MFSTLTSSLRPLLLPLPFIQFQDTSAQQWQFLLRLCGGRGLTAAPMRVAPTHSTRLTIVGDPKQVGGRGRNINVGGIY